MYPDDDIDDLHHRVQMLEDKAAARTFWRFIVLILLVSAIFRLDYVLSLERDARIEECERVHEKADRRFCILIDENREIARRISILEAR